jgi:NAD(P)-dependent dehydrogenase (short-subunit alcohol dehydrogenase family)
VKRLLLSQLPDKSERSSNIVRGNVILALDLLERHAPSQAPHHDCDRYAGAPNDGFAVGDSRIEDNAVRDGHGVSNDSDLAELVECKHKVSVSPSAGAEALISDSVKAFGRVDIVVNNAAISTLHGSFI